MTRKSDDTPWPHPRSESPEERAAHGPERHRQDRMMEGPVRESVDWMEYDEEDGGPKRRMVHLGVREEESRHGEPSDGGVNESE